MPDKSANEAQNEISTKTELHDLVEERMLMKQPVLVSCLLQRTEQLFESQL